MKTISICTVYHNTASRKIVEENIKIVEKLNPSIKIIWYIGNNYLKPTKSKVLSKKNVHHVDGFPTPNLPKYWLAGYHHASALNKLLKLVKTRFCLILDSDFYIIYPNALSEVLQYMIDNNVTLFGVPWHPKWFNKIRYFPCTHCTFIDLKKVNKKKIDFNPTRDKRQMYPQTNFWSHHPTMKGILTFLTLQDRKEIGRAQDTGHKLYQLYGNKKQYKIVHPKPVYIPKEDFVGPKYALTPVNKLIEHFLPESLRYFPKRTNSYTKNGFVTYNLPDIRKLGYEEFVWNDKPFGFHLRRIGKVNRDKSQDPLIIHTLLTQIVKKQQSKE